MDWVDIQFSVDLVEAALRHLNFLERVSVVDTLLRGKLLDHALRRYEQLWLPLATENRHLEIVPPIDIWWVWYNHMLNPLAYKRDCRKLVGRILDHNFKHEDDHISCANRTVEIWYQTYPKSGCNIIRNGEYIERKQHYVTSDASKLSVSLIGASYSHLQFCYQVSLPHFRDRKYLEGALTRYKQFLCLKKLASEEFLTPSVDIILMWYTHMCYPVAYAKDLTKVCGEILDNNVKVKYGLIDQNYITARDRTTEMWSKVSRDDFMQPGTKLRSSENKKEIFPVSLDDLKACCVIEYDIYLANIELIGHPEKAKFELKIFLTDSKRILEELVCLKGNRRVWSLSSKFSFNTHKHRKLQVVLLRQSKLWCFQDFKSYADGAFDLKLFLKQTSSVVRSLNAEIAMETEMSDSVRVDIDATVSNATPILCELKLVESKFEKQMLKSTLLRRTWGHYKMPDNIMKEEHECFNAFHSFQNEDGVESFRSRILHIPDLMRSGVEVFFGNKLVATSYVIGSPHLPNPKQVEWADLSVSFDPELGERAMLIRNHEGDWAICIARWVAERTRSFLDLRIIKLKHRNKMERIEIRSVDIQFQSFNANLHSGNIQINPTSNTVAENLVTMWSICILYVLCAPKDPSRRIKVTNNTGTDESSDSPDNATGTVPETNCRFLVAAGLLTEVPSNEKILKTYGSLKHDILMDAQDVIIAEQKVDRKLAKKERKIRSGDLDGTPRSLKKRKSKSSLRHQASSVDSTTFEIEQDVADTEEMNQRKLKEEKQLKEINDRKRKRMKKKKSSGLDDMLAVSDDSFTKEDVEDLDKVLVTDDKGKKVIKKKDSNYLEDAKLMRRDSFDIEAMADEEYYDHIETEKLKDIEEKMDPNDEADLTSEIREHTTIIKDVAEKKREDLFSRHGERTFTTETCEDIAEPDI